VQRGIDIRDFLSHGVPNDCLVRKIAIPLLITALRHTDATTRRTAAIILGKIGPDAKEALPALRVLLLDDDQPVRDAAQEAITKIDK